MLIPKRVAKSASSNLLYEVDLGEAVRETARTGRAAIASGRRHHIYGKAGNDARLSVPIHGSAPLKIGLLRHLAKLAQITLDD
jgi:predicted RNA binding protein YcfA (HicA-like mRNA interferase family)